MFFGWLEISLLRTAGKPSFHVFEAVSRCLLFLALEADRLVRRRTKCDLYHWQESEKEREKQICFYGSMQEICIQIRCLCIYQPACLQTVWLSGCMHPITEQGHGERKVYTSCLVLIPNCSSAFSFIALYWCGLEWLSHTAYVDNHTLMFTKTEPSHHTIDI